MRALMLTVSLALIACARDEPDATPDSPRSESSIVATPISLADVAGRWNMQAKAAATDSLLVRYVLDTKADTSGWTLTMADRPPTPIRVVAVEGDSITIAAGPYPSVLRQGVTVSTAGVLRLRGALLVGTSVATYTGAGVDSVLRIRVEGTRAP